MDQAGPSEYDRVMDFVMSEIIKNPKASNDELRTGALKVSPSVGELGIRQFQGKYRLPAIRKLREAGRIPPAPKRPVTNGRRRPRGGIVPTPVAAAPAPVRPRAPGRVARRASVSAPPSSGGGINRDAARSELMKFAMAVAGAEDQQATLSAVAKIDEYVERIAEASH